MSFPEEPQQPQPETPNHAGWATFEARVRARRLAACVVRADNLIDSGRLDEARETLLEAKLLAPDAPEIVELEQKMAARPSPGAVLLAAPDTFPIVTERIEPPREWPRVLAAVAVVLMVFFAIGYGAVKFRHRFPLPEFLATEDVTPAPDTPAERASESRVAIRTPEVAPPPAPPVAPPAPVLAAEPTEAQREPAITPERTQLAEAPSQPARTAPPATPAATIGRSRGLLLPPAASGNQAPTQSPAQVESAAIPQVRPLAEGRPVEAVALEMTSPTPTATTGAQPMATLDAPVPAPPPAGGGESRHDESLRIRAVLLRYENAYNRLDAKAARAVWPGVNEPALNRAFSGLVSQRVSLGLCDITVFGDIAGASCAGKARWEPKVGGGLQTADRYWSFQLTKGAEGWNIKEVLVR